jgi:hypothetical protein
VEVVDKKSGVCKRHVLYAGLTGHRFAVSESSRLRVACSLPKVQLLRTLPKVHRHDRLRLAFFVLFDSLDCSSNTLRGLAAQRKVRVSRCCLWRKQDGSSAAEVALAVEWLDAQVCCYVLPPTCLLDLHIVSECSQLSMRSLCIVAMSALVWGLPLLTICCSSPKAREVHSCGSPVTLTIEGHRASA